MIEVMPMSRGVSCFLRDWSKDMGIPDLTQVPVLTSKQPVAMNIDILLFRGPFRAVAMLADSGKIVVTWLLTKDLIDKVGNRRR